MESVILNKENSTQYPPFSICPLDETPPRMTHILLGKSMKTLFPLKVSTSTTPLGNLRIPKSRVTLTIILCVSLLPHLGHAGFWDVALDFGKNLLATAAGNYANTYQQDLTQLLQALRQPAAPNNPYGQQPGQSGYPNDPYAQQGYPQDPYGQQSGQPGYSNDPYAQAGYPQDPYGQQPPQQDPYAQQGYPQDPYGQQSGQPGYSNDPYAQAAYPQDPSGQQPPQQDPYGHAEYPQDPYGQQSGQPGYSNDPYAQAGYPQDPYGQQPQQQDPYGQTGYPQDPYAQQEYSESPTSPIDYSGQGELVGTPIGLDVAIVKKAFKNGAETLIPIQDGDVLKDGRGNAQAGDKFRIIFRPNCDCYIYVIAIDGSAWAQGIFPNLTSPFANPVQSGQQYTIPENNNWLSLDQFKGIETIFFVASPDKRQDIEDILANIAGKERHPKAKPQQVAEAPIIPTGFYRSQTSSAPFIIGQDLASPQGSNHGLIPTTYFTQKAGEALRVTRWFRHE